jgi:hypothetical protein
LEVWHHSQCCPKLNLEKLLNKTRAPVSPENPMSFNTFWYDHLTLAKYPIEAIDNAFVFHTQLFTRTCFVWCAELPFGYRSA